MFARTVYPPTNPTTIASFGSQPVDPKRAALDMFLACQGYIEPKNALPNSPQSRASQWFSREAVLNGGLLPTAAALGAGQQTGSSESAFVKLSSGLTVKFTQGALPGQSGPIPLPQDALFMDAVAATTNDDGLIKSRKEQYTKLGMGREGVVPVYENGKLDLEKSTVYKNWGISLKSKFINEGCVVEDIEEKKAIINRVRSEHMRDYRYWLLHWAQKAIYIDQKQKAETIPGYEIQKHALGGCCMGAFPRTDKKLKEMVQQVEIHIKDGKLVVVGLAHCGNPLCPVCGPIIAFKRALESSYAAYDLIANKGYTYIMETFTCGHTFEDLFLFLREGFNSAFRDFSGDRPYMTFQDEYGEYYIRALEVTDDAPWVPIARRTGFHIHRHIVFFFKPKDGKYPTKKHLEKIRRKLLKSWKHYLNKYGLDCGDHGIHIQSLRDYKIKGSPLQIKTVNEIMRLLKDGAKLDESDPKVKAALDHVKKIVDYITKSIGYELTGAGRKKGRKGKFGGGRISSWQLLEHAVKGGDLSRQRWLDIFYGSKKIQWIRFSNGLRDFVGLKKEKTDKELVSGGTGTRILAFGVMGSVDPETGEKDKYNDRFETEWRSVASQGRFGHLRTLMEHAYEREKKICAKTGERITYQFTRKVIIDACETAERGYDIETLEKLPRPGCANKKFSSSILGISLEVGKELIDLTIDTAWQSDTSESYTEANRKAEVLAFYATL